MKKQLRLISRAAVVALTAGAFCVAGNSFAQSAEESPSSDSSAEATASPSPSSSSSTSSSASESTGTEKKSTKSSSHSASPSASSSSSTMSNTPRPTGATGAALSRQDRDFMMMAAKGGMMEVHMGEMAEKMGQSSDVKKLGARMVADHTKVNNELMAIAQARGVKLDTRHKMDKMDSANFDQKWLQQMVMDHQKTIAAFETEAKSGTDPELKKFASKNLPTLKKHLQLVQAAQGKMGKGATTNDKAKTKQG